MTQSFRDEATAILKRHNQGRDAGQRGVTNDTLEALERASDRKTIAKLEELQDIAVALHFDSTAGRHIDDEITKQITTIKAKWSKTE